MLEVSFDEPDTKGRKERDEEKNLKTGISPEGSGAPAEGEEPETPEITEAQRLRQEAEDLTLRAREALANANREAEEVIRRAKSQADKIEAAAYQAGFEQGEEAGKRLSEQKTESVVRRLESVMEEMANQQANLLRDSEEELVKLAYLISLKLIHREIRQDPSVVLDVVKAGIEKLKRASQLTIHVSPHDFRFIEGHIERLTSFTETETEINIEPSDSIARGGCRIKSNTGEVDATIETMVRKLLDRIWGEE